MAQTLTGPATGRFDRAQALGKVEIRNRALKPRRIIPVGPPTAQGGVRPGRNEGREWLHQSTSEHHFEAVLTEPPSVARRPAPWALIAAAAGACVALALGLAFAL